MFEITILKTFDIVQMKPELVGNPGKLLGATNTGWVSPEMNSPLVFTRPGGKSLGLNVIGFCQGGFI